MLANVHKYKGKQELYIATEPELFSKLTDLALIQSTETSNKIEGVAITEEKLFGLLCIKNML